MLRSIPIKFLLVYLVNDVCVQLYSFLLIIALSSPEKSLQWVR